MPSLKMKSFWSWIYLRLFMRLLPAKALYYINKIASALIRDGSNKFISFFNIAEPVLSGEDACILPEPAFMKNGFLYSDDGLNAFRKFPDSPLLPEYIECQLEGLFYFDAVFRGLMNQASFGDVMVRHHQILSTGTDGRRNYPVGFSNEYSKDVAGKRRHASGRVAFPVRNSKIVKFISRLLAETDRYPVGLWDIEIDGLPKEAWSSANRIKQGFDIVHPDGKYIPLYFQKMAECINFMRLLHSKSVDDGMTLRALATYFHLGIHSHAFVRINQSLLWSQVNYILMLNGYVPVHHGHVDLAAAFLNTYHFCSFFERYVSSKNLDSRPSTQAMIKNTIPTDYII